MRIAQVIALAAPHGGARFAVRVAWRESQPAAAAARPRLLKLAGAFLRKVGSAGFCAQRLLR